MARAAAPDAADDANARRRRRIRNAVSCRTRYLRRALMWPARARRSMSEKWRRERRSERLPDASTAAAPRRALRAPRTRRASPCSARRRAPPAPCTGSGGTSGSRARARRQRGRQVVEIAVDGAAHGTRARADARRRRAADSTSAPSRGAPRIARAVDRRAVADVEQPFDGLGPRRARLSRCRASSWRRTACARAAGRAASARQPSSCIMSSSREPGERGGARAAARSSTSRLLPRVADALPASAAAVRPRRASSGPTAGCAPAKRTRRGACTSACNALWIARAQAHRRFRVRARRRRDRGRSCTRVRPDARVAARRQRAAQQPRLVFAAHRVAPEPEEILDEARRDVVLALQRRPACARLAPSFGVSLGLVPPSTQSPCCRRRAAWRPRPRRLRWRRARGRRASRETVRRRDRIHADGERARAADSGCAADFHTGACERRTCSCAT